MKHLLEQPSIRYLAASLAAVALDYGLTLTLFYLAALSLTLAAFTSFFVVGLAFYFVHEFWTFRGEGSAFSVKRMGGNLAVLVAAGAVRVGMIGLMEALRVPEGIWVSLYFAAGVACSFATSYFLNRFVVFCR
jgi:putative flippase GtrA